MNNIYKFAAADLKAHAELTHREEQVKKACERAKRTGKREDLERYLRMRRK